MGTDFETDLPSEDMFASDTPLPRGLPTGVPEDQIFATPRRRPLALDSNFGLPVDTEFDIFGASRADNSEDLADYQDAQDQGQADSVWAYDEADAADLAAKKQLDAIAPTDEIPFNNKPSEEPSKVPSLADAPLIPKAMPKPEQLLTMEEAKRQAGALGTKDFGEAAWDTAKHLEQLIPIVKEIPRFIDRQKYDATYRRLAADKYANAADRQTDINFLVNDANKKAVESLRPTTFMADVEKLVVDSFPYMVGMGMVNKPYQAMRLKTADKLGLAGANFEAKVAQEAVDTGKPVDVVRRAMLKTTVDESIANQLLTHGVASAAVTLPLVGAPMGIMNVLDKMAPQIEVDKDGKLQLVETQKSWVSEIAKETGRQYLEVLTERGSDIANPIVKGMWAKVGSTKLGEKASQWFADQVAANPGSITVKEMLERIATKPSVKVFADIIKRTQDLTDALRVRTSFGSVPQEVGEEHLNNILNAVFNLDEDNPATKGMGYSEKLSFNILGPFTQPVEFATMATAFAIPTLGAGAWATLSDAEQAGRARVNVERLDAFLKRIQLGQDVRGEFRDQARVLAETVSTEEAYSRYKNIPFFKKLNLFQGPRGGTVTQELAQSNLGGKYENVKKIYDEAEKAAPGSGVEAITNLLFDLHTGELLGDQKAVEDYKDAVRKGFFILRAPGNQTHDILDPETNEVAHHYQVQFDLKAFQEGKMKLPSGPTLPFYYTDIIGPITKDTILPVDHELTTEAFLTMMGSPKQSAAFLSRLPFSPSTNLEVGEALKAAARAREANRTKGKDGKPTDKSGRFLFTVGARIVMPEGGRPAPNYPVMQPGDSAPIGALSMPGGKDTYYSMADLVPTVVIEDAVETELKRGTAAEADARKRRVNEFGADLENTLGRMVSQGLIPEESQAIVNDLREYIKKNQAWEIFSRMATRALGTRMGDKQHDTLRRIVEGVYSILGRITPEKAGSKTYIEKFHEDYLKPLLGNAYNELNRQELLAQPTLKPAVKTPSSVGLRQREALIRLAERAKTSGAKTERSMPDQDSVEISEEEVVTEQVRLSDTMAASYKQGISGNKTAEKLDALAATLKDSTTDKFRDHKLETIKEVKDALSVGSTKEKVPPVVSRGKAKKVSSPGVRQGEPGVKPAGKNKAKGEPKVEKPKPKPAKVVEPGRSTDAKLAELEQRVKAVEDAKPEPVVDKVKVRLERQAKAEALFRKNFVGVKAADPKTPAVVDEPTPHLGEVYDAKGRPENEINSSDADEQGNDSSMDETADAAQLRRHRDILDGIGYGYSAANVRLFTRMVKGSKLIKDALATEAEYNKWLNIDIIELSDTEAELHYFVTELKIPYDKMIDIYQEYVNSRNPAAFEVQGEGNEDGSLNVLARKDILVSDKSLVDEYLKPIDLRLQEIFKPFGKTLTPEALKLRETLLSYYEDADIPHSAAKLLSDLTGLSERWILEMENGSYSDENVWAFRLGYDQVPENKLPPMTREQMWVIRTMLGIEYKTRAFRGITRDKTTRRIQRTNPAMSKRDILTLRAELADQLFKTADNGAASDLEDFIELNAFRGENNPITFNKPNGISYFNSHAVNLFFEALEALDKGIGRKYAQFMGVRNPAEARQAVDNSEISPSDLRHVEEYMFASPGEKFMMWFGAMAEKPGLWFVETERVTKGSERAAQLLEKYQKLYDETYASQLIRHKKAADPAKTADEETQRFMERPDLLGQLDDFNFNTQLQRPLLQAEVIGHYKQFKNREEAEKRAGQMVTGGHLAHGAIARNPRLKGNNLLALVVKDPRQFATDVWLDWLKWSAAKGNPEDEPVGAELTNGLAIMSEKLAARMSKGLGSMTTKSDIYPDLLTAKMLANDIVDAERTMYKFNFITMHEAYTTMPGSLYKELFKMVHDQEEANKKSGNPDIDIIFFTSGAKVMPGVKALDLFEHNKTENSVSFVNNPIADNNLVQIPVNRLSWVNDSRHVMDPNSTARPTQTEPNQAEFRPASLLEAKLYLQSMRGKLGHLDNSPEKYRFSLAKMFKTVFSPMLTLLREGEIEADFRSDHTISAKLTNYLFKDVTQPQFKGVRPIEVPGITRMSHDLPTAWPVIITNALKYQFQRMTATELSDWKDGKGKTPHKTRVSRVNMDFTLTKAGLPIFDRAGKPMLNREYRFLQDELEARKGKSSVAELVDFIRRTTRTNIAKRQKLEYLDMYVPDKEMLEDDGFTLKLNNFEKWNVIWWEAEKVGDLYYVPGALIEYTRIPADGPHSHTMGRLQYRTPLGSGLIQAPLDDGWYAGADYDVDARTVQVMSQISADNLMGFEGISTLVMLHKAHLLYSDVANFWRLKSLTDPTDAFDDAHKRGRDQTRSEFEEALKSNDGNRMLRYSMTSSEGAREARENQRFGKRGVGATAATSHTYSMMMKHGIGLKGDHPVSYSFKSDLDNSERQVVFNLMAGSQELEDRKNSYVHIKNFLSRILQLYLDNPKLQRIGGFGISGETLTTALTLVYANGNLKDENDINSYMETITDLLHSKTAQAYARQKRTWTTLAGTFIPHSVIWKDVITEARAMGEEAGQASQIASALELAENIGWDTFALSTFFRQLSPNTRPKDAPSYQQSRDTIARVLATTYTTSDGLTLGQRSEDKLTFLDTNPIITSTDPGIVLLRELSGIVGKYAYGYGLNDTFRTATLFTPVGQRIREAVMAIMSAKGKRPGAWMWKQINQRLNFSGAKIAAYRMLPERYRLAPSAKTGESAQLLDADLTIAKELVSGLAGFRTEYEDAYGKINTFLESLEVFRGGLRLMRLAQGLDAMSDEAKEMMADFDRLPRDLQAALAYHDISRSNRFGTMQAGGYVDLLGSKYVKRWHKRMAQEKHDWLSDALLDEDVAEIALFVAFEQAGGKTKLPVYRKDEEGVKRKTGETYYKPPPFDPGKLSLRNPTWRPPKDIGPASALEVTEDRNIPAINLKTERAGDEEGDTELAIRLLDLLDEHVDSPEVTMDILKRIIRNADSTDARYVARAREILGKLKMPQLRRVAYSAMAIVGKRNAAITRPNVLAPVTREPEVEKNVFDSAMFKKQKELQEAKRLAVIRERDAKAIRAESKPLKEMTEARKNTGGHVDPVVEFNNRGRRFDYETTVLLLTGDTFTDKTLSRIKAPTQAELTAASSKGGSHHADIDANVRLFNSLPLHHKERIYASKPGPNHTRVFSTTDGVTIDRAAQEAKFDSSEAYVEQLIADSNLRIERWDEEEQLTLDAGQYFKTREAAEEYLYYAGKYDPNQPLPVIEAPEIPPDPNAVDDEVQASLTINNVVTTEASYIPSAFKRQQFIQEWRSRIAKLFGDPDRESTLNRYKHISKNIGWGGKRFRDKVETLLERKFPGIMAHRDPVIQELATEAGVSEQQLFDYLDQTEGDVEATASILVDHALIGGKIRSGFVGRDTHRMFLNEQLVSIKSILAASFAALRVSRAITALAKETNFDRTKLSAALTFAMEYTQDTQVEWAQAHVFNDKDFVNNTIVPIWKDKNGNIYRENSQDPAFELPTIQSIVNKVGQRKFEAIIDQARTVHEIMRKRATAGMAGFVEKAGDEWINWLSGYVMHKFQSRKLRADVEQEVAANMLDEHFPAAYSTDQAEAYRASPEYKVRFKERVDAEVAARNSGIAFSPEVSGRTKTRKFNTYEQALKISGLVPQTTDLPALIKMWQTSVAEVARNKRFFTLVSTMTDMRGFPVMIPIRGPLDVKKDSAISDRQAWDILNNVLDFVNSTNPTAKLSLDNSRDPWVQIDAALKYVTHGSATHGNALKAMGYAFHEVPGFHMQGVWVQEGAPTDVLKHITSRGFEDLKATRPRLYHLLRLVKTFNSLTKFLALSISVFHHFAITESYIAALGLKPYMAPNRWANDIKDNTKAFMHLWHAFWTGTFDGSVEQTKMIDGKLKTIKVDMETWILDWVGAGMVVGEISPDLEAEGGVDSLMDGLIDLAGKTWLTRHTAGNMVKALKAFKQANDKVLWQVYQPILKLQTAERMLGEMNADPRFDHVSQTKKMADIAMYTNDIFGGQLWERYLWANPMARDLMQSLIFAPDWTMSALQASGAFDFLKNEVGLDIPLFERQGTSTKYAQETKFKKYWPAFILITLLGIPAAVQAAIYGMFGDPDKGDRMFPWQNEEGRETYVDFTALMRKLGWKYGVTRTRRTYLRWGKSGWELLGWVKDAPRELMAKSSMGFKTLWEQATGSNTAAWDMPWKNEGSVLETLFSVKGEFGKSRTAAVLEKFMPMSFLAVLKERPTTIFAPAKFGMSEFEAIKTIVPYLDAYANADVQKALLSKPEYLTIMRRQVSQILDAAELNGYDRNRIFKQAVTTARAKIYFNMYSAVNRHTLAGTGKDLDTKEIGELTTQLRRLGATPRTLKTSLKVRAKESNVKLPGATLSAVMQEWAKSGELEQGE